MANTKSVFKSLSFFIKKFFIKDKKSIFLLLLNFFGKIAMTGFIFKKVDGIYLLY
jgi:hypothetical protein